MAGFSAAAGEALGWPTIDDSSAAVPSPGYRASGFDVDRERGRFAAQAHVIVEDRLIDLDGSNALHRAIPQEAGELGQPRAIHKLATESLPFRPQGSST